MSTTKPLTSLIVGWLFYTTLLETRGRVRDKMSLPNNPFRNSGVLQDLLARY